MTDYDNDYKTENLFGNPYPELINFFKNHKRRGRLLDLGCGQGRDAIPLAKLGFYVSGIDVSETGIKQMLEKAEQEGLNVRGLVSDINAYEDYSEYDVILADSLFHFEEADFKKETNLVKKITGSMKTGSLLCICIQDSGDKAKILKETLSEAEVNLREEHSSNFVFNWKDPESGEKYAIEYFMYAVRKI